MNRPDAIKIGTVGRPLPGTAVRVADDGELLFQGGQVFAGYWRNEEATAEALEPDGWFHTGDLGEVDDEGFVRITGRKKEIIVTAGGKNVAPAVLEDRVRAHLLVDQCIVVGDGRPFIGALVTIDRESFPLWAEQHDKTGDDRRTWSTTPTCSPRSQEAVDEANKAVSKAESIRKFTILPGEWTEEGGQLTPSLKLKRNVVMREHLGRHRRRSTSERSGSLRIQLPGDRDPGQPGRVRAEPELRRRGRGRVGERAQRELALHGHERRRVPGGLSSASTSARVSIWRLMPFWTGAASSEPIATSASTSGTTAGSRMRDPVPASERAHDQRRAGRRRRPRRRRRAASPISTSSCLAWASSWATTDSASSCGHVVDEVVVEHHPAGAAEAGDVGVQGRRTARRVGDQHVVDRHALAVGELEDRGAQLARRAASGSR